MNSATVARAPWHLWAVGVVSLLWNGFGGYDYIMSQTRNADYMRMMTEPYGFDAQMAVDYFDSFPLWADCAWAVGVWGSVLGSLLLLSRIRFARHAFVASMLGLAVAMLHQLGNPLPGLTDSTMTVVFTLVIIAGLVLQTWYASAMARRGVLR
jgi:hypothetical protein